MRDAACEGGEAFSPAGAPAVADSLQELSLSGVTHVSGVTPIYLTPYLAYYANAGALKLANVLERCSRACGVVSYRSNTGYRHQ